MKTCWKESELLRNNPCFWDNTWAFYVCVGCENRTHDARLPGHHISAQEKTRCKKIKNSWQTVVKRADASDFALFNLKSIQIPLYFELVSGKIHVKPLFWVIALHVWPPFDKNFYVFCIGFSPEPRYDGRAHEHHAHGSHSQRTRKRPRVDSKIPE